MATHDSTAVLEHLPKGWDDAQMAIRETRALVEIVRYAVEAEHLISKLLSKSNATGKRVLPDGATWPGDLDPEDMHLVLWVASERSEAVGRFFSLAGRGGDAGRLSDVIDELRKAHEKTAQS